MQTLMVVAAGVTIAALLLVLARSVAQIGISSYRVTGQDGQEREECSFSAWRSNTLLGYTLGSAYIAVGRARFGRQERRRRALAQ